MNRFLLSGGALVVLGLGGYALGVATPYPGRAFAVTAVMLGITLVAVRAADEVVAE